MCDELSWSMNVGKNCELCKCTLSPAEKDMLLADVFPAIVDVLYIMPSY